MLVICIHMKHICKTTNKKSRRAHWLIILYAEYENTYVKPQFYFIIVDFGVAYIARACFGSYFTSYLTLLTFYFKRYVRFKSVPLFDLWVGIWVSWCTFLAIANQL